MVDRAHSLTDKKLEEMEKHLTEIYSRSQKELEKKTKKFWADFERKDNAKKKKLDAGEITEADYKKWRQGQLMTGKHWDEMTKAVAEEMMNADKTAVAYVNEKLPEIYALNYNALGDLTSGIKGYSFELVDAATVRNLATSDKTLLPYKTVNGEKAERWNTQKVNAEVMQGIIQGESIPNIAKRLKDVVGMEKASAIRNARTTTTSAENKGRMDSYHDAQEQGIVLKKRWMATHDHRTREEHIELDGKEVDVDEPFENSFGKIMYPGDPDADPSNVHNCRCSIISRVVDFKRAAKEMSEKDYLSWQEKSSTQRTIEKEFEEKYGVKYDDALWGRKDEWIDSDRMWLSDIAKQYEDDVWQVSSGYGHCGYIQSADGSKAINAYLRRGEKSKLYSKAEMQKTIDSMNRLIDKTEINENIVVDRWAGIDALKAFGIDVDSGKGFKIGHAFCTDEIDYTNAIQSIREIIGSQVTDKGFMSASVCSDLNVFKGSDIKFKIYVPKGTKAYISENIKESEIVFSPNTAQEITGVRLIETEAVDYEGKKTERKTIEIALKILGK